MYAHYSVSDEPKLHGLLKKIFSDHFMLRFEIGIA